MKAIGMIVPTLDNIFFAKIAYEVEKQMKKAGYLTLVASCQNKAENEKEYIRELQTVCQGIVCISGLDEIEENLIEKAYPFVLVDRKPKSAFSLAWSANDDKAACKDAVNYLIEKGCKKIVLCPGFLAQGQISPRVVGYEEALAEHGIEWKEEYVLKRAGIRNTETETEEIIERLLYDGEKIDGIIASSDRAAFGAMTALEKVGYYVPEDVKLITFDNSPYTAMATPSITAMDRNPKQIAMSACRQLMGQINHETYEQEEIIEVSLIERDSTR
ncbi:hypothetical protein C815_00508 [Firmicutes bacterium M10-2]|nr:hypothetical protein C815_00508 [Firmicutes bacterium M10-2]